MAASYPVVKNGAVALPNLGGVDIATFDYGESQSAESVACYGTAVYDPYIGSGTPHAAGSVGAFAKAHAANTQPFGATIMAQSVGNTTLTLDTGITLVFPAVITSVRMSHARLRAAVPLTFNFDGAGDTTTTWPVS